MLGPGNNGLVPAGSVVLLYTGWQDLWFDRYAFSTPMLKEDYIFRLAITPPNSCSMNVKLLV